MKKYVLRLCLVFICMAFVFTATTTKADALRLSYKVKTVYCENNDCQEDKTSDSRLQNALNKMLQEAGTFNEIKVIPIIGHGSGYVAITSGYTIIMAYYK